MCVCALGAKRHYSYVQEGWLAPSTFRNSLDPFLLPLAHTALAGWRGAFFALAPTRKFISLLLLLLRSTRAQRPLCARPLPKSGPPTLLNAPPPSWQRQKRRELFVHVCLQQQHVKPRSSRGSRLGIQGQALQIRKESDCETEISRR